MKTEEIVSLKEQALAEASAAETAQALEDIRIKYLSRNGMVPEVMKSMKNLTPEERPEFGKQVNALKTALQEVIEERKQSFSKSAQDSTGTAFDYTLPGQWRGIGKAHPINQIIDRCVEIFRTIGFTVADGPDVETVANNFDALNTPAHHPSRDPQDTFYLDPEHLLRTHTSPVQVRYMKSHKPPVRIVAPGRAYRRDTPDATHSPIFHQIEGLYIDETVSLADLKGDLTYFAQQLLGADAKVRLRPHFFPFTEPSVEVDFSCHGCHGEGCRICKQSGWIEIAGAGLVDPNVLQAVGYDPEQVTGYAFGMGIERMAMVFYGVKDIRDLYDNDIRFLRQF